MAVKAKGGPFAAKLDEGKPGILIEIPGSGDRDIRAVVSDYTGTLSFDGRLIPGVEERLRRLEKLVDVHVVSADSFGTARRQLATIPLPVHILQGDKHDQQKRDYLRNHNLNPRNVAVLGNGNNDRLLLRAVKDAKGLAVALDNGEGCALQAILNADLFVVGIVNALDLLLAPIRCKATLRR
jgi:soluble P-type ATPase